MHPFLIGELACGNLKNRREVLALLERLRAAPVATQNEVIPFIERHSLMARGVGFIDVHLLASAPLGQVRLWTQDHRLAEVTAELGLGQEGAP
jgi:predicted nucleic acid-binding protein